MKRKKLHISSSFRFCRWCRKTYAVFRSIGQYVTIGHLSRNLSEQTLKKQKSCLCPVFPATGENNGPEEENSSSPAPSDPKEQLFIIPALTNAGPDYPCNFTNYPIKSRKTASGMQFSGFLFLLLIHTVHHD